MEYSWFTMLDWFVLYCKVDQLYTYPLFFRLFSHLGHYRVMSSLCYAALLSILYTVVCICQCQIPSLSPHFSPDNHKSIFYICDCFINKFICASFKVIVYDMSLSDLLYSVWQYQGPSNVAADGIISLLFMTNILLYMYVPHLFYSFLCWWTFRLLPCFGYCKQCCKEH